MSNGHGGARQGAGRPRKSGTFAYPEFTTEQLKELLDSPYVLSVSKTNITFTKAFKLLFWQRYCDGITPFQIFDDAGIPSKVVSSARIYSFTKSIKSQADKGLLFSTEDASDNSDDPALKDDAVIPRRANHHKALNLSTEEIAKLVNQVAYMSQELAFLKKIILADKEKK